MQKIEYKIISEKDAGKSTKEIEVEVSAEALSQYRSATLKKIVAETELPGFRKGKAPEAKVLADVGESSVLEQAANDIVNEVVFSVLAERQLRFIGQPSISVTKLASGNPFQFKMTVSLVPEVILPDYKKIAATINGKKEPEPEVAEREMEEALAHIKKIFTAQGKKEDTKDTPPFELTDETVKQFGGFETVAAFKEKLKVDLLADKKVRAKEKRLLEIIEGIVADAKADVPEALVEHELDRIESEFMNEVGRMGMKPEDYLEKIKKTREELRKEWHDNALKRAKFELIIPRIAKAENLSVAPEDVDRESKHLREHHKDIDEGAARLYTERFLIHQKVLEFLGTRA